MLDVLDGDVAASEMHFLMKNILSKYQHIRKDEVLFQAEMKPRVTTFWNFAEEENLSQKSQKYSNTVPSFHLLLT